MDQVAADATAFRNYLVAGAAADRGWTDDDMACRPGGRVQGPRPTGALRAAAAAAPRATAEEARQREVLATLEALAGANSAGVSVRRHLLDARGKLGQAYLDAGRAEEARAAFDAAATDLRRLAEDHPKNEQLRIDLANSQLSVGDAFAAAGRLAEAVGGWGRSLATLEEALRANPVSVPAAGPGRPFAPRGDQCGRVRLWDRASGTTGGRSRSASGRLRQVVRLCRVDAGDRRRGRLPALVDRVAAARGRHGTDLFHLGRALCWPPTSGRSRRRRAGRRQLRGLGLGAWCRGSPPSGAGRRAGCPSSNRSGRAQEVAGPRPGPAATRAGRRRPRRCGRPTPRRTTGPRR